MLIRRGGTVWRYCLATCYLLLTTHYSLLTAHYSLLTTHHLLLTTRYSLLATYCSQTTAHYLLLTTYRVEVRSWSPASEGDSIVEQLRRSIGRLMGRYAATLVASIPLSEAEVKLQRWLDSPIFARNPDGCVPPTPKQIAGYVAATTPPFLRSRDADGKRTDKAAPPELVQLLISHTPQEPPYSYLLLTSQPTTDCLRLTTVYS